VVLTLTVCCAVLPCPDPLEGVTENVVLDVTLTVCCAEVVDAATFPPVQLKFVGAPPPLQLAVSVTLPPPSGNVLVDALSEQPLGAPEPVLTGTQFSVTLPLLLVTVKSAQLGDVKVNVAALDTDGRAKASARPNRAIRYRGRMKTP
jgi:hypothetical protein